METQGGQEPSHSLGHTLTTGNPTCEAAVHPADQVSAMIATASTTGIALTSPPSLRSSSGVPEVM